jgi:hypothetical protein
MADLTANTDNITIDESGWSLTKDDGHRKLWIRDVSDGTYATTLMISFNLGVVDFGAPLTDLDSARELIRLFSSNSGSGLVSADVVNVDDFPSLKIVQKEPQSPAGMTYVAILMIQCNGCFFNVLLKSVEVGYTGVRDAIVLDRYFQRGVETDPSSGMPVGWFQDPYNPYVRESIMRNPSDDETYDLEFPDHPLSRVRRYCRELEAKATIDKSILRPGWTESDAWWKRRFADTDVDE